MPTPVISIAQMREWENKTFSSGMSEAEVIRRVGRVVAERAVSLTKPGDLIIVLAGRGNNGADARSALEQFEDRRVDVLQVRDPLEDFDELETLLTIRPALLIDGLFGIGLNRSLDAHWVRFIERINAAELPVLAIDVPSGLDADSGEPSGAAIEAAVTLTVGAPKRGLVQHRATRYVGRLEITGDVGLLPCPFKAELNWTAANDFAHFPSRRRQTDHKGSFGHLAILAGSTGYHGASVLAARGAQRARPGLITLFPTAGAFPPAASQLQAVMVQPWSKGQPSAEKFDAILAGPGLAGADVSPELRNEFQQLWRRAEVPMIADASALDWLPAGSISSSALRVITPHPGEAARLLGKTTAEIQSDRIAAVRELSARFDNCWIVLKGHQTAVGRNAGEIYLNSSGSPSLAQGGSGDVLAGFIAGLLVQPALQKDALRTLRYGVWQHGAAADHLDRVRPNWVVEDLADQLGMV